jgi:endoglucanase
MRKQFTSPRRFDSFQVIRQDDGAQVFGGGAPVRELRTNDLGATDTVWVGDFSGLATPGRYRIVASGLVSYPFDVGRDVFDRPLRAAQRAFYFQRAFTAIDPVHAEGPWTHPSDAAKAPPGVHMGWHDAGDFSIYSATLNTALFWLLETYSDFMPSDDDTNIPESGNRVPDLLDEARWGVEWLLSVQDESGGFANSSCEERYGPYGSNSPESVPRYRAGEIGTLATARAVGNLAYASTIWRSFDPSFADRCLTAARRGYGYLEKHRESSDGPTCPAYRAEGNTLVGRHTRMFAAAGMLLATGEPRFRDDFEENYQDLDYDPSYLHFNGFAAQLYLRSPTGDPSRKALIRGWIRRRAAQVEGEGNQNPFHRAGPTHWGSIGAGFTRTGSYSVKRCLDDPVGAIDDCEQALANVHYALGRNYLQFCYVSGLPGVTRGRTRAFHHWLAALRADPFLFPGAVAGGPNDAPEPADGSNPLARPIPIWGYWDDPAFPRSANTPFEERYTDNDSWSTNEVSLDWQASTLYGLYFARWVAKSSAGARVRVEATPAQR